MYGSATLAMVVSSACMIVAVMAQIVTMFRRRPGTAADGAPGVVMALIVVLVRHRRRHAEQGRQRAAVVGVDRGVDAHAGFELADVLVVLVEIDPYRNALHHLDEIARCVLRRQDRELRAGA